MLRLVFYILLLLYSLSTKANEDEINLLVFSMQNEIEEVQNEYFKEVDLIHLELKKIRQNLSANSNLSTAEKLDYFIEKDALNNKLSILKSKAETDISKIRYLKGIQIVKLLYEKVLSLDHHFSAVQTITDINRISNPNEYPEFKNIKQKLNASQNKKEGYNLTELLGTNAIVSVTNTFLNLFNNTSLSRQEKEDELKQIECIIDFTLRKTNDLNLIYYETEYLKTSNETIKKDIEALFKSFAKPLSYHTTLSECRNNDDWSALYNSLNKYVEEMNSLDGVQNYKMRVELGFPVDQLIRFIYKYNDFIEDGESFYLKFATILSSYENEEQCQSKLKIEYSKLKNDIHSSIDKFRIAYKPVEINGSKLKEIIYGLNEFN